MPRLTLGGMTTRPADWYHDPMHVGVARWHNGAHWTPRIAYGKTIGVDPTPLGEVERQERRRTANEVSAYLTDARARQVVDAAALDALGRDLDAWVGLTPAHRIPARPEPVAPHLRPLQPPAPAVAPRAPAPDPSRRTGGPPSAPSTPLPSPAATGAAQLQPVVHTPSAAGRWVRKAAEAVRSDLAVHGLAYLGVLLLFSGVTGLMVFSFDEVRPGLRVLSELLVPVVFLLSAWFLRRRDAAFVGSMLELVGLSVIPLVAIASVTDGSTLPPDLSGPALALTQAALAAVAGVAMLVVARRAPSSMARHIWAPSLWLAAGLAAGATVDPVPSGPDMARPHSVQLASMIAAIALTTLVLRRRTSAPAVAGLRMALPSAAVVVVLELVAAGVRGWPIVGAVISGVSMIVLLELLDRRIPSTALAAGQAAAIALTAVRLGVELDPTWVAAGAFVVLAAFVELTRWRRPTPAGEAAGLAPAVVALLVSFGRPGAALTAFGVATAWSLVRHVCRTPWISRADTAGAIPALAALVVAAELWRLIDTAIVLPSLAAVVLAIAVAGRARSSWRTALLWRWWVPVAAVGVSLSSIAAAVEGLHWTVVAASCAAAVTLALSSLPAQIRVWLVSAVTVWAGANALMGLGATPGTSAMVLALAGLVLVLGSMSTDRPVPAHLHAVGLLAVTLAPISATSASWALVVCAAAATVAWAAIAAVHERRTAPHLERLRAWLRGLEFNVVAWTDTLPAFIAILGAVGVVVAALDASDLAGPREYWTAAAVSAIAVLATAVVRVVRWSHASGRVLLWQTALLAVVAALPAAFGSLSDQRLGDERAWQLLIGLGGVLGAVVLTAAPRPSAFRWIGWSSAGALVPLVARQAQIADRWIDVMAAGVGAVALVAVSVVDRRRRPPGVHPLTGSPGLVPPAVVATLLLLVGGAWMCTDRDPTVLGWSLVGLAAAAFAIAGAARVGSLTSVGYLLATLGLVLLATWEPIEHPWSLVPVVVVLLSVAWVAHRRPEHRPLYRWDMPAFVVAHVVAVGALAATVEHGSVPATTLALSAVAFAVAAVLRKLPWLAAGAVLAVVGAAAAGPGWLSAALACESIAAQLTARRLVGRSRRLLLVAAPAGLVASWIALLTWLWGSAPAVLVTTMIVASLAALGCAVALRLGVGRRDAGISLLATPAALTVMSIGTALGVDIDNVIGGLTAGAALLVLATAAAQVAPVFGQWMRGLAGALATTAWFPLLWAWRPTVTQASVAATSIALLTALVALALRFREHGRPWVVPAHIVFGGSQLLGLATAVALLPDRALLAAVLLAIAAELVVVGTSAGRVGLYVLAPSTACAAWVVYASDALRGDPNWFSVPIGVSLLVTVAVLRWLRRRDGKPVASADIVVLELVGMCTTVAAALVAVVRGDLWYSLLAIVAGVLLAGWGAVTRVRRRLGFGVGTVVVTVLLLMIVPLATADIWTGAALWLTVISVGAAAILVAAFIERGKVVAEHVLAAFGELTEGWERIDAAGWLGHDGPTDGAPPPVVPAQPGLEAVPAAPGPGGATTGA